MEVSGKVQSDWEVCEPCRLEGTSTRADGFCEDCEEFMCHSCFGYHQKFKGSRNHVLGSLSQGQAQSKEKDQGTQPCQKHPNYNLRYYCRKHDKVACGDCIVAEHKGCEMEFINDIAKQFENTSEFTRVAEQIKGLEGEYKENKRKQEINRREVASISEKVQAEIKRFRIELNECLDNAEKEIVMEAERLSKENDNLISDLEIKVNQVKEEVDRLNATLDTSLYKGDILFIRFVESKRLVSDVERSLAEIKTKNYINKYTFYREERLADLMASKVKLGTLKTVTPKTDETSSARKQSTSLSSGRATGGPVLSKPEPENRPAFPTPTFKDPDPRARGFDVGKRAKNPYGPRGLLFGTVTSVEPAGYVQVKWDDGGTGRYNAGAGGLYYVVLV